MTSTSIYPPLSKPTYLYIKQHSITKKKYFGKTTNVNPYEYNGSGKYWTDHIKKHGKEHIETLWVSYLYYDTSIVDVALQFSFENNIVESKEWANQKPENGLDGGDTVSNKIWITNGVIDKYNNTGDVIPYGWVRGRTNCVFNDNMVQSELSKRPRLKKSIEEKHQIAMKGVETRRIKGVRTGYLCGELNPSKNPSNRIKASIRAINRPIIICPHCDKEGQQSPGMYKWHFENCKQRPTND